LKFEKREILLILGITFLMIGMMAFLPLAYALAIAILIYFGIKVFVGRRKRQIQREVGMGVCAICGTKIVENRCPHCDSNQEKV